ncbi:hypothetical protein BGZ89_010138 [Linnemannia elongata]|nr:hypothetical protein BGZ89_010138 [Linnemannia elongata]
MTIQQQRRPTTSTRASERSTLKKSLFACFVVLSTLAAIATAEIQFTSPPANSTYRPGDTVLLTWIIRPPNGTIPVNNSPFDLTLRAASLQRYNIQANIDQAALSVQIQIPADVTGGLHSFYALYRNVVDGQSKPETSRQFNIPLPIVTMPPATRTNSGGAGAPTDPASNTPGSSGGLSAGMLGGIIGGVIAVLMAVAMCFLCRHRRRVAEDRKDSTSRSMDGKSGLAKEGGGTHQDKESLTKSAGSAGGIPDMRSEGQEAVPLKLNRPIDGSPRSQHQNQHQPQQHQNQNQQRPTSPTATRNPFEAPEMMIHPNSPNGAPSPRQQNQNHQYQSPQLPPPQQSPFGTPPQQYSGMPPNPLMGGQHPGGPGQRNQSPYHQNNRDSFESELESAYDPHPRMMPPSVNRNNGPSPMNNGSASPLGYSSSTGSSRYPHNMSPQPTPGSPLNQHAQDREILAVAAAVAAAASPVPAHRQVPNQQNQLKPGASPRMKEIEMQQFDVQQHHQEQQQKMLQRQQQQQQQRSAQSTPTPLPAAQKSMNPTQFDDKAEFSDSDDELDQNPFQKPQNQQYPQPDVKPPPPPPAPVVAAPFTPAPAAAALVHPPPPPPPAAPVVEDGPVYNGYRDTIFGAYANNQDDDDEDEDNFMNNNNNNPVPALPPVSAVIASPPITATASTTYQPPPGGAEIVRKKSVKFTGVPKSGPIVLPNHEAAKEHQQQRQQIKQQQQQQQNQNQQGQYNQEEDSDEFYSQDDEEVRARMLETAESVSSPSASISSASFNKPTVNTANGTTSTGNNTVLSPIRSPGGQQQQQYSNNPYQLGEDEDSTDEDEDYMNDPYGAYSTPMPPPQAPYAQQGHPGGAEGSPRINAVVSPADDDDFFGDVLAAVDKTAVPPPPTSSSSTTSQSQFNPDNFVKPKMPAMPSQEPPQVAQYGTVQQQHIPPAQPQHLTQEVFGAPSPRMKPAALPTTTQQYQQQHGYPAPPPPAPPARAKGHSPVMQKAANNANSNNNNNNNGGDTYF